jgi:3-dehydroquinate synthase
MTGVKLKSFNSKIIIKSGQETYQAKFSKSAGKELELLAKKNRIFLLVDSNVDKFHPDFVKKIDKFSTAILFIEPFEKSKQMEEIPTYINKLIDLEIRRGDLLVGVGGGIIQDITGFIATILYRGLDWIFIPTTLAAQADSCIGSKTSINLGERKNTLGTYYPAKKIFISKEFLKTLNNREIRAGLGEMLKVHAIESKKEYDLIAKKYESLIHLEGDIEKFIYQSLMYKKKKIEKDEKDQGPRLVMNYGHSFGHALEAASDFRIPHGIAVSMGMDIANFIAIKLNYGTTSDYNRMHPILMKNSSEYWHEKINQEKFSKALLADKKNKPGSYVFILTNKKCVPTAIKVPMNKNIDKWVFEYIEKIRKNELIKK